MFVVHDSTIRMPHKRLEKGKFARFSVLNPARGRTTGEGGPLGSAVTFN